jgi:hypothetical protein
MVNKGFSIILVALLLFLFSCNKQPANHESQQQQTMQEQARQQAIQDSIARVQAKKEAQLAAQRERERMNQQNTDSSSVHEPLSDLFTSSGDYTLQVSSWRSQWKALKELKKWKERGFSDAYLMKYGNEKTGNIWFRVRLGHLQNRADGEQVGKEISGKYNVNFWVSYVG